ncbi:hypothetical protein ZEAMMB73_Zm00001d007348 [Zea mays]|uniref:Uncharacterized protein n=1 Tax=Zea mays TaxID=4577 RepID=A0A1D6F5L9_MAIZE|nr:hypothetical protein ZEAMMB73_Zm00001d007348 [Zea mays]
MSICWFLEATVVGQYRGCSLGASVTTVYIILSVQFLL